MASSLSSVITCINSALQIILSYHLSSRFSRDHYMFKTHKYRLWNLKAFVLLAGKFWNPVPLGSLLIRIEDVVTRNSPKIPPNSFDSKDFEDEVLKRAERFVSDCRSLKEGVNEWYIATSANTGRSNSLTADEVGDIFESIWENLVDVPRYSDEEVEAMEHMRQHVNFLKNLCRFATSRGVDHSQMKDFLTHAEPIAICAAHVCFMCGDRMEVDIEYDIQFDIEDDIEYERLKGMLLKISMLIQKIKPLDPQVCETYIKVISCSKLSARIDAPNRDKDEDSTIVMKNFVDSLIPLLWDMLQLDICHVVCLKDNWQLLYEGLRSLRTILKKLQPKDIDEKTSDDIGDMICHAGVLVCSFYNKNVEIDLGLQDLLERIKVFLAEAKEEVPQTSTFNPSSIDVRVLVDDLIVGDISMQFDSVREDIQNIKADAWKISSGMRRDIEIKEGSRTSSHLLPSQNMASVTPEVVGLQDDARFIMDRLQRGPKKLQVIAIVGMGGLGKTTLAAKVYDDPVVMRYFSARARCTVSQTLDKRKLLLELLANNIHAEKCSELTEDDLAERLWKHLKGKRYLIFLDDVWTIEAWDSLKASFPDDGTGSRIILTSRNDDAAPILDQEPLHLRLLNKEESLALLQKKLFNGEDWPPSLYDLGMQMVEMCKGLPLTIVLFAGLLAKTEQEGWKEIVNGLSSGSITEQCMNSMELSYQHLPDCLKPCFLYFGALPEDQEVSVRRLIRLWIAEGFIRKGELKSLEDTAEDYLKDLIGRSLIMVAKERCIGGVKTCRIHDLLHDFCVGKAKGENLFHLVKGYEELLAFNEPCNLGRLCIHSESKHFKESKLFCPRARSLLFFSQKREWYVKEASINIFLVHVFKFVSVLNLEGIHLGDGFPSEIELLVQLRYLAIRCNVRVIPSWVGNLSMLETFIADPVKLDQLSFPDTIWNLQKLKYIYIRIYTSGYGGRDGVRLPIENLDGDSVLYQLDTFCGAALFVGGSILLEEQMRTFPNIRKLKCIMDYIDSDTEAFYNIGVPDFLTRLESLTMKWGGFTYNDRFELSFPANLKKLTLSRFMLPWSKISTIGQLPNLEVLKLLDDAFDGFEWEMEEGEFFPKLRYLKLSRLNLSWWRTASDSDNQFPCLEKLVLENCEYLKEMPTCLESIPTLEMIEVRDCWEATNALVKEIKEQREVNMGEALNILLIESFSFDDFEE